MTLLLALVLMLQEDPSALLERMRSDDVRERDAATRRLETLGLPAVEQLLGSAGNDLEVQGRLRRIIGVLKKRAEITRVCGPTKRVTASFKLRPLSEVLQHLRTALDEPLRTEKVDESKLVDLELRQATLWETLDALSRAADLKYEYGRDAVTLLPGARSEMPVRTVEQFRVSVGEMKRLEHRSTGLSDQTGVVVLLVDYQRNLTPVERRFSEAIQIDAVSDGAGRDLAVDTVDWASGWSSSGRSHGIMHTMMIRPGEGAFTIEGRARFRFGIKTAEISIPLADGKRSVKGEGVEFEVREVLQLPKKLSLKLHYEGDDDDLAARLVPDSVQVIDTDGKSHASSSRGSSLSAGSVSSDYAFNSAPVKPDRLVFRWIREFHVVEIPFRFDGLKLP